MHPIVSEISRSLLADAGDRNRRGWSQYIVEHDIPFEDLLPLLEMEKNVRTRFSWLMGDIVERDPKRVYPSVAYLFHSRNRFNIVGFDRSVAKLLWLAGVPEEIEGEALEQLFSWIQDAEIKVAVKVYAMSALFEMTKKYPELKNELKLIIEDQYDKNSVAFVKRADRILKEIQGRGF